MFYKKLLVELRMSLLGLCFLLFLDSVFINYLIEDIDERNWFLSLWASIFGLLCIGGTLAIFETIIEKYYSFTINHFLDTYIFPKELSKILSEKYPHLEKSERGEVLEAMKEFYRFEINKTNLMATYMPSHVVDFACQTFFDMPNSSLFFKKILLLDYNYKSNRVLPNGTETQEMIIVLLAGQHKPSINSKISDMWCYCCKKENIDPLFPFYFPSFFTLDKRLKIPSGFIYELDEPLFRKTHPLSNAPNITLLEDEIRKISNIEDIDYLAKKIQYYLGSYSYCHKYQKKELKKLFKCIDKNKPLALAIYGQYSDVNIFKEHVFDCAAMPPLPSNSGHGGCSSSGGG